MLDKLVIRNAISVDANILNGMFEKLLNCEKELYDENISNELSITSFFDKRINDEYCIIKVAIINDIIVGYIYGCVDYDNKIKTDMEATIESIYIEQSYRNQKIGTSLINEFIDSAKKMNVKYILIDNFSKNEIAKYLYEKLGFAIIKESRRKKI